MSILKGKQILLNNPIIEATRKKIKFGRVEDEKNNNI